MTALKTFLATLAAASIALVAAAAPAAADTACWVRVINDWYDGRIDNTYPIPCYQEAIRHLPEDVQTYASAADQIQRAMYDAIRHDRGDARELPPASSDDDSGAGGPAAFGGGGGDDRPTGVIGDLVREVGPSNAQAVPLPLLVLAGIALLLLAAALASFVARRIQARRIVAAATPATAPARANSDPA